uniref:Uncharacterized protein n=1 Tax=Trichobilharzia regenti TaxID=157069 RepID=A0AA85J2X9_TRIRE|nr:unnamed protein product [Trichobilharzia regenti]CAH8865260.1 unnamed protein product [Trichobilharzia regenti]
MVYFTYSHVAVSLTVISFAAIISGESTNVTVLESWLNETQHEISKAVSELKVAEGRVKNITDKILSQDASLRGEIEDYMNCLETAYKYKWGKTTFDYISERLLDKSEEDSNDDMITCYLQEATVYEEKMKEFPVEKCFENQPPAKEEDLEQLKWQIESVFYYNYLFSSEIFYKNFFTTKLNILKGN